MSKFSSHIPLHTVTQPAASARQKSILPVSGIEPGLSCLRVNIGSHSTIEAYGKMCVKNAHIIAAYIHSLLKRFSFIFSLLLFNIYINCTYLYLSRILPTSEFEWRLHWVNNSIFPYRWTCHLTFVSFGTLLKVE